MIAKRCSHNKHLPLKSLDAGTADNGNLHAFDVAEYQLLATWPFDDVTGSSDPVTSVACSLTNQHVAASAGQLVKVWDFRFDFM